MRVLFWGTPDFATPALRALLGEGFDVVGVVTQPDRPVGRSRSTVHASPVKCIAVEESIPVVQPERPRGDAFLDELTQLAPDLSVVVAYGHILPNAVGPVIVAGTIDVAAAIILESSLSFLGLGFPPDIPTWGRLLFDAKDNLDFAPHWAIFPGTAIFLAVLSINYIGDGLRDALDPRKVLS